MMKKKSELLGWIIFYTYLVLMAYFLFFSERYGRSFRLDEHRYNLVLFQEIKRYMRHHTSFRTELLIVNLLGNVLAFAPFGFMLPMLSKQYKKLRYIGFLSFEVSLLVELVQLVSKTGIFDVDDIFLNTLGGVFGYLFFLLINWIMNMVKHKHR